LIIGTPVFLWLGLPILGALLIALSIALSSSVVIVNITRSPRRTTNTATEEALLGWSVVQDVVGVAAAAIILTLFGANERPLALAIGGLVGFILLAYVASKLLPKLLQMVRWEKDLFLIYSVSVGLVLAALGPVLFGIPMALAAFVAGLAINQSRDTEEVRKAILPFRDLFAVLFFVVIGTLIEPTQIVEAWPFALLLITLLIGLKTLPIALFAKLGKLQVNKSQFAIGMSQVGEFSFVLGSLAFSEGALTRSQFTGVLMAVVISIIGSTLLVRKAPRSRSI
jgi:CPA2 family monovalent cation:H+ antiporter-2